jgi:hypothetical protein
LTIVTYNVGSSTCIVFKLGRFVEVPSVKYDILGQGQGVKGQGQTLKIGYLCL